MGAGVSGTVDGSGADWRAESVGRTLGSRPLSRRRDSDRSVAVGLSLRQGVRDDSR